MNSETQFNNLHADLTRLLPLDATKRLDPDCFSRFRYDCLELFAEYLNRTLPHLNSTVNSFSLQNLDAMCQDDKPQPWVTERAYVVALTMAILGCIGLAGNIMSCVVITMHLLRFSGTFVLFLFLSMSDSLVVVMQVIDAYRNFVAVSQYTAVGSEQELTVNVIQRRDWSCKSFLFFWHFALQLSAWLVMALSVDRYASLKHIQFIRIRPFLYRRAWIIVGSIVAVLFLLNLPFLIFVKSTVIKTHCALNHFCVFGGLDSLWTKPVETHTELSSRKTTSSVSEQTVAKDSLEVISIREAVESPNARSISLWLSRQHLFVFGIIPYVVTFIFNMVLINYLCSCPSSNKHAEVGEWGDKPHVNTEVRMDQKVIGKRIFMDTNCFTRWICCRPKSVSVKRKSTTSIPLMPMKKPLGGMKWNLPSSNHQMQPQSDHAISAHNVKVNLSDSGTSRTSGQKESAVEASSEPQPQAISTVIHESTDCNSDRCLAKCIHLCDGRHLAGKDDCTPAENCVYRGREYRPQSTPVYRLNTDSGRSKRTQTSSSGFWIGQKRTTILLLVVTFTFIGLTLPYHIYVELEHFHKVHKGASTHYDAVHAADDLCRFLLFLNNCINFIVYMTGRQFRKGFFMVLHRIRQSVMRWILCQPTQTDARWHRHPPNRSRRNRLRNVVRDQKQACRLIFEANQAAHRLSVHPHYVSHEPGCPMAVHNASLALSVGR